jgi:hypothetical protein
MNNNIDINGSQTWLHLEPIASPTQKTFEPRESERKLAGYAIHPSDPSKEKLHR